MRRGGQLDVRLGQPHVLGDGDRQIADAARVLASVVVAELGGRGEASEHLERSGVESLLRYRGQCPQRLFLALQSRPFDPTEPRRGDVSERCERLRLRICVQPRVQRVVPVALASDRAVQTGSRSRSLRTRARRVKVREPLGRPVRAKLRRIAPTKAPQPPSRAPRAGHPPEAAERLHAVEERVHRGRTALDPLREAVAARAAVVGRHIDRARRAALDHLSLDAHASQRAVVERGGDGRPDSWSEARASDVTRWLRVCAMAIWPPSPIVISLALTTCDEPRGDRAAVGVQSLRRCRRSCSAGGPSGIR